MFRVEDLENSVLSDLQAAVNAEDVGEGTIRAVSGLATAMLALAGAVQELADRQTDSG